MSHQIDKFLQEAERTREPIDPWKENGDLRLGIVNYPYDR